MPERRCDQRSNLPRFEFEKREIGTGLRILTRHDLKVATTFKRQENDIACYVSYYPHLQDPNAMVERRVRIVARFPSSSHLPILYSAALTTEARPGARAFLDFLDGSEAQSFFESAGFTTF